MKKYLVVSAVVGLFILGLKIKCFANEIVWQNISRENSGLKALLINPDNPGIIYVGVNNGIFKTEDGGASWRNILSVKGQNRTVNFLLFDARDCNSLYAATGNGLFWSSNQGKSWKRIFQGKNYLENECSCILVSSNAIYLGTKAGLFVSQNMGSSWHKEQGRLGKSSILAIAYNKIEPDYIYVACIDGVFRTVDLGQSWERIFVTHPVENGSKTGEEAEDQDEQERVSGIRYISCNPNNLSCVYVATSRGVYKSCDRGQNWEPVSSYGLLNRDVKFLLFSNKANLYAIAKSGIFEYVNGRWQELSFGLTAEDVSSLALDSRNNLYAACDKGLFKANTTYSNNDGGGNIVSLYYKDEPKINEVQQAAIKYAEVEPVKIIKWRKQAARKALLPQVSVGVDRNVTDLWHWEGGSTTKIDDDILRKGKDSVEWDVSLSWDLGELIWNNDQTSIDVRSRLMVELRDDILDEVTKLYFERLRIKMEIDNLTIEDGRKRSEKELKLQELAASLDALTGGYFSAHLSINKEGS